MSTAVGKKKRVVYVKSRKSPVIPLLIVGGAALWWFLSKKDSSLQPVPDVQQPAQDPVTGEPVIQPPPIVADNANATALQSAAAINDRAALVSYDPANTTKYKQMNDAETIAAYSYVFGYVVQGKKLYQYPNTTGIFPDGGWDTALYNAVKALQLKYGIFL